MVSIIHCTEFPVTTGDDGRWIAVVIGRVTIDATQRLSTELLTISATISIAPDYQDIVKKYWEVSR